jgi:hypothetical protein
MRFQAGGQAFFAAHLRELAHSNHLPDYEFRLDQGQAVFTRREPAAALDRSTIATLPSPARPAPVAADSGNRLILISESAMEQVREVAPGWDKHMLERMYVGWAAGKDQARNEDARFLGWARSFTKSNPP